MSRNAARTDTRPAVLLSSLRGYRRAWVGADARAALTLLAIAVPEQLATARLAGMPPLTGVYAFVAGSVMFAMLGSSPQLSVGADSTVAPLFAAGVAGLAATGSPRYMQLVAILAVLVGLLVAAVWLLRLGWIAEFLSTPIITGFLAGVAIIIVVHQLPDLLGIAAGSGSTVHRFTTIADHLDDTHGWALAIGAGVLGCVVAAERIDRRLPGALIGLVIATGLTAAAHLHEHGLPILGAVTPTAPKFELTGLSLSAVGRLAPLAAIVALVIVTQSAATTRAFADPGTHGSDVGRDLLGVGAGNVLAGFVGAFPVNASPPRTAAVAAASGRTQAAGLGAAAAILLLVPAASLLTDLPPAALAGVLVYVAGRIFRGRELASIARFSRFELALALVTMLAVALIGVVQGIGVAVGLAILDRTRISARPKLHVLGRIPGTTSWVPLGTRDAAAPVPGVLVVLFATALWYANAVNFRAQLRRAVAADPDVRLVVLDAAGMTDIDYTGCRALSVVLDDLARRQIAFGIARAGAHVRENLARGGLLERIGDDNLFAAVDGAVATLSERTRTTRPAAP